MDETGLRLKDIFRTLKKHRMIIISVFLFAVVAAAVTNFFLSSTYEAETTLRVKQPPSLANSLLADLPVIMNAKQLMSTYSEILKSRTVVQAVIDRTQSKKATVPTYEAMLGRINIQQIRDTEVLRVHVQADSPAEAQYVANILVEAFIERLTYLAHSEQTVVREFIGERLKESRNELERAESTLQQYKQEQNIAAPQEETKALVERQSFIDKIAAENTVALASNQAKLASVRRQLDQEKPGFVADSYLIQQYKARLAELEVQLVSLSQNYTDKYPQVVAARAAIAETKNKLNSEAARIVSAEAPSTNPVHLALLQGKIQSEAEIEAATAQKEAIDRIFTQGRQELIQLPGKEQGLARVMRDASVAQEIYIMLAKRHEEARINEVMQQTDIQVIDVAVAPGGPIKPRKRQNVAIAALLGLMAGIGLAFIIEHMNKTISSVEDVSYFLDLPVLGSIPDLDDEDAAPRLGWWGNLLQQLTALMGGRNDRDK